MVEGVAATQFAISESKGLCISTSHPRLFSSREMSTIALLFLVFFSAPVLGQWLNISNGKYVLGADLAIGGYFGHFAKIGGLSTINIHDAGRGIQMSFYAGPAAYDNCTWQNTTWPWNPIEGGIESLFSSFIFSNQN